MKDFISNSNLIFILQLGIQALLLLALFLTSALCMLHCNVLIYCSVSLCKLLGRSLNFFFFFFPHYSVASCVSIGIPMIFEMSAFFAQDKNNISTVVLLFSSSPQEHKLQSLQKLQRWPACCQNVEAEISGHENTFWDVTYKQFN